MDGPRRGMRGVRMTAWLMPPGTFCSPPAGGQIQPDNTPPPVVHMHNTRVVYVDARVSAVERVGIEHMHTNRYYMLSLHMYTPTAPDRRS